ncbi:MAG: hypothetical protein IPN17_33715 [Deltaproteobacteria bacterium]|nr:hypothetical protein [Deltaproteobacteria bacterium]
MGCGARPSWRSRRRWRGCAATRCVNQLTDPAHCGSCNSACPAGRACAAGRCTTAAARRPRRWGACGGGCGPRRRRRATTRSRSGSGPRRGTSRSTARWTRSPG